MKNGIPCNETQYTPGARRNQITYRFVTGDKDIPARCTIQLGSTDPITGERLTEVNFFREYYRLADHEIYQTLKAKRPQYTQKQKDWREKEAESFCTSFKTMYGYAPSRDDVLYHLEQLEKCRYCLSIDEMTNDEDEQITDFRSDCGYEDQDPFGADLSDDIYMLREIVATLSDRRKAVYEAMLDNLVGGTGKTTNVELARLWGVSEGQIRKDQKMIIKMIREALQE